MIYWGEMVHEMANFQGMKGLELFLCKKSITKSFKNVQNRILKCKYIYVSINPSN